MPQKEPILVSACLLGVACRYDGDSRPNDAVWALAERYRLIPVCPESMGGLPIPREPSEIVGDRVVSRAGSDVTEQYRRGAQRVLSIARKFGCRAALLKEKSPSCGTGTVHNGKFDGGLTDGYGVTAALLRENGVAVFGESGLHDLVAFLGGEP
ncbi:MAG: DUF523 domain-containing protein [Clostridia bacterium]|nr:DUF523 domain-containing protein [Clostridia bacterium]